MSLWLVAVPRRFIIHTRLNMAAFLSLFLLRSPLYLIEKLVLMWLSLGTYGNTILFITVLHNKDQRAARYLSTYFFILHFTPFKQEYPELLKS